MSIFLHILFNNVIPISIVISIGIVLQRIFALDIRTLSKLNFYLFSPCIMFELLYTTNLSLQVIGQVLLFFTLFMLLQYGVLEIVVRLRGYQGGMRAAMRNSVLFYNSANYGIPINQLAFAGNTYTLSIQVLIMMMQSLIPNTYGIYSVNAHKANLRQVLMTILSMPTIYVIPLAFIMRGFAIPIPLFLEIPIGYIADAFFGMALFTLGVQLGSMSWKMNRQQVFDVSLSGVLRLVAGPVLAFAVVYMLDLDKMMGAALIVSSAVPTSLSSVLLAVEFDNEKEFSSQTVLVSTMLSMLTVSAVIYFVQ
ncbi:MAG: AEC family transporter [Paenibacillus sp.]|nr:AEC family transporter [Paenibacillus sp.]